MGLTRRQRPGWLRFRTKTTSHECDASRLLMMIIDACTDVFLLATAQDELIANSVFCLEKHNINNANMEPMCHKIGVLKCRSVSVNST
jgi:hypothetical protein